jgi:hypothetical protein
MSVVIASIVGYAVVDAERESVSNIPTNTVIERNAAVWADQYESPEEFEKVTKETLEYLTVKLEPGWNSEIKQASLKAYNFGSIVGKRGAVDELVSLLSAKEQLLGIYTRTDAETTYHAWMQSQFDIPKNVDEIDSRIYEIIGDESNYNLAIEAYEARNFQANNGAVPEELIKSDLIFWATQASLSFCNYDPNCDVEEARKIIHLNLATDNSQEEIDKRVLTDEGASIMDYFLPRAYADWDPAYHWASMYISADTCDGTPCYFQYQTDGTGQIAPNASSGSTHTTDTTIYAYGTSWGGSAGNYHTVVLQMVDPAATNTLVGAAYDGVVKDGYLTKSSSESIYSATNTSNAYDP